MPPEARNDLLKQVPSVSDLLKTSDALTWLKTHPARLVTDCLRAATDAFREKLLAENEVPGRELAITSILREAECRLGRANRPALRAAINATGIILHTGLGRAVFPESVVDSIVPELKGYCTLAVQPETGERVERDELVEALLCELTGAEAATVVNNNAAATLLVLAGLASEREVIVSRGQLIEIGGSFRLPEVMQQSRARLVEVGATNRTHLRDYERAITPETSAIMRVHPSNYRIVGFTSQPALHELAGLAHRRQLLLIDDLGAGALLDLEEFGMPHEPTVRESIAAGADVVLFSGDKLIGASQAGIIVGRKPLVSLLRKHPLMRAVRVDKTCLMVLERTLRLFREPQRLRQDHPLYRMLCTSVDTLRGRAEALCTAVARAAPEAETTVVSSTAFLGSGALPTEEIPSFAVTLQIPRFSADELALRLRLDDACIFARIESGRVLLDVRTVTEAQLPLMAEAVGRVACSGNQAHSRDLPKHSSQSA